MGAALTWEAIEAARRNEPRAPSYFASRSIIPPTSNGATIVAMPAVKLPKSRKSARPVCLSDRAWFGPAGVAKRALAHLEPIETLRKVDGKPSLSALLKTDAWKGSTVELRDEAIADGPWHGFIADVRDRYFHDRIVERNARCEGPSNGRIVHSYVITHPSGARMRLKADAWAP